MLQATCQFNRGLGCWQRNINDLRKQIAHKKILRRAEKQLRRKISKRRTRQCMKQLLYGPVVYVRNLDGPLIYKYLKRGCSNTGNDVSIKIVSSADENNENRSENRNDNLQNARHYPELKPDAVGSPFKESFFLNKTSIKFKQNYSKYKYSETKENRLSSQEPFNDEEGDENTFLDDAVNPSIRNKCTSTNLHSNWKSDIPKKKNIITGNDCVSENIYKQIVDLEDLSDMETRVGTSKHKRISRISNPQVNLEKDEKLRRIQAGFKKTAERKRRSDHLCSGEISRKIQKQHSNIQVLKTNPRLSEGDTRGCSSKQFLSKRKESQYNFESLRFSSERDHRKARHCSSPYPDKKRGSEKYSTRKKNVDREKTINQPFSSLSSDEFNFRDRSLTKGINKSSRTQSKEIKTQQKLEKIFGDGKELEENYQFIESKKQKTTRSSIDSGIGRVTPTRETSDNTEHEEQRSKHHYNSERYSKGSKHSSESKIHLENESMETLERTQMKLLEELNATSNDEEHINKPLSLPFINDSDDYKTDNNLIYDNHTKDCSRPTNESHRHDKTDLKNNEEISSNEVNSTEKQKVCDDRTSISEGIHQLLPPNVVDYSSSSDESNDHFKLMINENSVHAPNASVESTEIISIENKTNIKRLNDNSVGHEDESAEPVDDKFIIKKQILDTKAFLNSEELSKSSQNPPSNQNSTTTFENALTKLNELIEQKSIDPEIYMYILKCLQKENDPADSSTQKSTSKISDNEDLGFKCKPMSPPPTQKEPTEISDNHLQNNSNATEPTEISDNDLENNSNATEPTETSELNDKENNSNATEPTETSELNDKENNTEKLKQPSPPIPFVFNQFLLDNSNAEVNSFQQLIITNIKNIIDGISSNVTTSTQPTSTNPLNSLSKHPTVVVPTTSSITTESQTSSHFVTSNESCSSTTLASQITNSTFSTATSTTEKLSSYQNSLPCTLPMSTADQLSTSTIQKPPSPYCTSSSYEHHLQQNNSSAIQSNHQLQNIPPQKQEIHMTKIAACHQLLHKIIEDILTIRKCFKEFESITQNPNYNPSSFMVHPLSITATNIYQNMLHLKEYLKCDWDQLYKKIIFYSQSYPDSTKRIELRDIENTVRIYCYRNAMNKLSPRIINSQESQGSACIVPGCIGCPEEPVRSILPGQTINYNRQTYSSPAAFPLQQSNVDQMMPTSTSMRIDQNQGNYAPFSTTPQQYNISQAAPKPVQSSMMSQNQGNYAPLSTTPQQYNISQAAPKPVQSSRLSQNQGNYAPLSTTPQQYNISQAAPKPVQSSRMSQNQGNYAPFSTTPQQYNISQAAPKPVQSSRMSQNQENYAPLSTTPQQYNISQAAPKPVQSSRMSQNQGNYAPLSTTPQQYNISQAAPKPVQSSRMSQNQGNYASLSTTPQQCNISQAAPMPVQSSRMSQNQGNYAPLSTTPQQYNISQAAPKPVQSSRMCQNQQNNIQPLTLTYLLTSTENNENYNQFQAPSYQPSNIIPTQASVLSSEITYNNQQYNNQAGSSMFRQSNMMSAPVELSTMNNQQFYNQSKTSNVQQPIVVPTSIPSRNANNNQQFHSPQPFNQQLYNPQLHHQSRASMSQQSNVVPTPVPLPNTNNNQQYSNNSRNLSSMQRNIASTPVSSQTNNNQQYNNHSSTSKYSQQYTVPLITTSSTATPVLLVNTNNNPQPFNQPINIQANILLPQQRFIALRPKLSSNNNQSKTVTSQQQNVLAPTAISPTIDHNQQHYNQSKVLSEKLENGSTLTSMVKTCDNKVFRINLAKSSQINLTSVQSDRLQQDNHTSAVQAQAPQPLTNQSSLVQPDKSRQDNRSESVQALAPQPLTNPSSSVQSSKPHQTNYSETVQTQAPQPLTNPSSSVQSNVLQQANYKEAVQTQASQPLTNPSSSIQSDESIQAQVPQPLVNSLPLKQSDQTNHSKSTPKNLRAKTITNNQNNRKDNSIMVSQAIESLSSLPMNYENTNNQQLSTKKAKQSKTKDTENEKVCSNGSEYDSSTRTSVKNNDIGNNTIEQKEIKQNLDGNDSLNSSQQILVTNEAQDDLNLVILVEVKKEATFSNRNKEPNHVTDFHDITLEFLNDAEDDKDSQKSIKEIKLDIDSNVSANETVILKTEKSYDKANSKLDDAYKTKKSLENNDLIILDDDDDENDNNNKNDLDLDRVSIISSDRETLKMNESDDEIIVEKELIRSDTYAYTKKNVLDELECALLGESSAFSSIPMITDIASITNDAFNNMKETETQNNDVPDEADIKLEIDENEYYE